MLEHVPGMLPERLGRDALLLLTELVNNAVIHGSRRPVDIVEVEVRESSSTLRVEVRDAGAGFEWRRPPEDSEGVTGYGLILVDAVADRWGVEASTGRTSVWFEI
jgi:anti-sigma regulatory factor (Ser/Thr protein kinase)